MRAPTIIMQLFYYHVHNLSQGTLNIKHHSSKDFRVFCRLGSKCPYLYIALLKILHDCLLILVDTTKTILQRSGLSPELKVP